MSKSSEIIDLTDSFTLADHCGLSNEVIDLLDTDDSLCIETENLNDAVPHPKTNSLNNVNQTRKTKAAGIAVKKTKKQKPEPEPAPEPEPEPEPAAPTRDVAVSPFSEDNGSFGFCPICWDALEKNPLASTKCGHVYCLRCIQEYVKVEKMCPMCRKSLKGASSYHPIYL